MPSSGVVIVMACTRSTPSAAKDLACTTWYSAASSGSARRPRYVPVAAGPVNADDQGAVHAGALLRTTDEVHSLSVGPVKRATVVADLLRPVRIGPPGGGLEQEALSGGTSDRGVLVVVGVECGTAGPVLEQREGSELREIEAVVEHQVGLEPAVGDEPTFGQQRDVAHGAALLSEVRLTVLFTRLNGLVLRVRQLLDSLLAAF